METFVIGRSKGAAHDSTLDVAIEDSESMVSGRHAELTLSAGGRIHLADLDSLNHTYVFQNGVWSVWYEGNIKLESRLRFAKKEADTRQIIEYLATNTDRGRQIVISAFPAIAADLGILPDPKAENRRRIINEDGEISYE